MWQDNHPIYKTVRLLLAPLLAAALLLLSMASIALAQETDAKASTEEEAKPPTVYARVLTDEVPVYAHITKTERMTMVRTLGTGYLWITLEQRAPLSVHNRTWYHINKNEFVPLEYLSIFTPSVFQGITFTTRLTQPMAWMVYYVRPSITPGVVATDTPWLLRYQPVTIYETTKITEYNWYRVGEGQWVHQHKVALVKPISRPPRIAPHEKWIEVNTYEQTLAAYQGDELVYATLVSSGLPRWETIEGLYRVRAKVKSAKMSGGVLGDDYYYLEDVPLSIYFEGAYALHGAYWHDGFGFPQSHGCVNLALPDARWLFDWATPKTASRNWSFPSEDDPGTWVWVHDGSHRLPNELAEVEGGR